MKYTWDEVKNEKNYRKHGIWFEEACTVFADGNAIEIYDEDSSDNEDRYILLGLSSLPRLLVVVYCERVGEKIRVISARKATKKEGENYEKGV